MVETFDYGKEGRFYSRSAKFKIKSSRDRQYYFVLIAPNNEVVATSEMYSNKQKCKEGTESVKRYA
ncbi:MULTISPECIES: YegP family protein [Anoxybacillus]|uniref:YegP family protein n=1 Tax=Anoxybacillus TaxID=150247 RepID=UPI001E4AD965|nr:MULTISPECIES: YegP family protein [Anoxybacillus]